MTDNIHWNSKELTSEHRANLEKLLYHLPRRRNFREVKEVLIDYMICGYDCSEYRSKYFKIKHNT